MESNIVRISAVRLPIRTAIGAIVATVAICFVAAGFGDGANDQPSVIADGETKTVKEMGAVGDGNTDDTAAIQLAVDSKVGDVRFPRGVYRITRTITIELDRVGPTAIVADGPARIVMDGPGPAFRFVGTHKGTARPGTFKDNIWRNQRSPMVDGLEIVGAHPQASGIEATGTMQLTITRVVVRKALHGIHLVGRNRNVIVSDCHIYNNTGVGIYYDNVNLHQSNIIGSHISYNAGGGIVVRGGEVRNVHIGTCDIEGNMGGPDSKPTANVLLDSTGGSIGEVAIVGCTIQHSHHAPNSANIRINGESTDRSSSGENRYGYITIADNVLSDAQVNIDVANTRGVTITGNTMWKGHTHDLRVHHSESVVVSDNVFDRSPLYHYYGKSNAAGLGLIFTDSDGCTISGNHILGVHVDPAAVVVRDCRRFNITDCTILDCGSCALLLDNVSSSRVSDCLIRNDLPTAGDALSIKVSGGKGNMIVNNLLGNPSSIDNTSAHVEGNHGVSENR